MPRTARVAPRDYVYHILTRGNNRQIILKDEEDCYVPMRLYDALSAMPF